MTIGLQLHRVYQNGRHESSPSLIHGVKLRRRSRTKVLTEWVGMKISVFVHAIECLDISSSGQIERLIAPREEIARSVGAGKEQPMFVGSLLLRSSDRGPTCTSAVARHGHADAMAATATTTTGTNMPTNVARRGV